MQAGICENVARHADAVVGRGEGAADVAWAGAGTEALQDAGLDRVVQENGTEICGMLVGTFPTRAVLRSLVSRNW